MTYRYRRLQLHIGIQMIALLLGFFAAKQAGAVVTYQQLGRIVIKNACGKSWSSYYPTGQAPALSPDKSAVAFIRDGNLFIQRKNGHIEQVTRHPSIDVERFPFDVRVTWHRSGNWVLYTRIIPAKYDKPHNRIELNENDTGCKDCVETIWIIDINSKRTRQIVGPMGNFQRLVSTDRIEGASVYEPIFSPAGKSVCFLNGGSLYEQSIDLHKLSPAGKPHIVVHIGDADLGAKQIAWDFKRNRLCYWIGRFSGSGVSEYGYVTWKNGNWGRGTKWQPELASDVRKSFKNTNIHGCAFDDRGYLWVQEWIGNDTRWLRQDADLQLPQGTGRPDWGHFAG